MAALLWKMAPQNTLFRFDKKTIEKMLEKRWFGWVSLEKRCEIGKCVCVCVCRPNRLPVTLLFVDRKWKWPTVVFQTNNPKVRENEKEKEREECKGGRLLPLNVHWEAKMTFVRNENIVISSFFLKKFLPDRKSVHLQMVSCFHSRRKKWK